MSALIELPVDHGHDHFTIGTDGERVRVEMWSRGTFTVDVRLRPEDARAVAIALLEVVGDA